MLIRLLAIAWLTLVVIVPFSQEARSSNVIVNAEWANREKYLFKVKTKSGGIVGNILIEGKDLFHCISKLKRRYPGCTVLEAKKK